MPGGTSFTLNNQTFYSANANAATGATPVNGSATLGLNTNKPAFTITTGWGNMIPRKGGHWSFPFETGVAFIGAPTVNVTLAGWVCEDQAQTECTSLSSTTNPIASLRAKRAADAGSQVDKRPEPVEDLPDRLRWRGVQLSCAALMVDGSPQGIFRAGEPDTSAVHGPQLRGTVGTQFHVGLAMLKQL